MSIEKIVKPDRALIKEEFMKKKTTLKWRRINLYKDTVVEVEGLGVGKKNLDKNFRKNKAIQKENTQSLRENVIKEDIQMANKQLKPIYVLL